MSSENKDNKTHEKIGVPVTSNIIQKINGRPVNPYKKITPKTFPNTVDNKITGRPSNPYKKKNYKPISSKRSKKKTSSDKIRMRCTEDCYATYKNVICSFSTNFYPSEKEVDGNKRIEVHSKYCYKYKGNN